MTQAINQDLGTRMDVCAIWHRAVHLLPIGFGGLLSDIPERYPNQ